ncbi:UNVERIFIED_CONTAM: hypothetical protein FKN15_009303 [Acipenser sinensis]
MFYFLHLIEELNPNNRFARLYCLVKTCQAVIIALQFQNEETAAWVCVDRCSPESQKSSSQDKPKQLFLHSFHLEW